VQASQLLCLGIFYELRTTFYELIFHGKEINDHKSESEAEVFEQDDSALFQVRPSARFLARFQSLQDLFP